MTTLTYRPGIAVIYNNPHTFEQACKTGIEEFIYRFDQYRPELVLVNKDDKEQLPAEITVTTRKQQCFTLPVVEYEPEGEDDMAVFCRGKMRICTGQFVTEEF